MGSLEIPEILCTVKMGLIKVSGEMLTVLWGSFLKSAQNKWSRKVVVVYIQYGGFKRFADAIKLSVN